MSLQLRTDVVDMASGKEVIERIARNKGIFTRSFLHNAQEEAEQGRVGMLQLIEGQEELRRDLSKALNIISMELYTSKARFLMEVIQNADDTEYPEFATPELHISVTRNWVKIECNEKGFQEENIVALCRTGQSSKTTREGYIGEKGIGFKSVFKVAQRAHIRSPPYFFQLDKDRELGMITPKWDKAFFADHPQAYQTTIILDRICDHKSRSFATSLETDVESLHPMILLFLRKIKQLHITLSHSTSPHHGTTISKRFRRFDKNEICRGFVYLKDEDSKTREHFYKIALATTCQGDEPKRPNVTYTKIVLAFPIKPDLDTWAANPTDLPTFAYLPLGYFNFLFIIQADFLTAASRQAVDEDSEWNLNIAKAIPHGFIKAVHLFNKKFPEPNGLGKTWPLFLNENYSPSSRYWRNLEHGLIHHLKQAEIVQTQTGSYAKPESLMFMEWARDRNDEPIFGTKDDYISLSYPNSVWKGLELLGITAPDHDWVLEQLQKLHRRRRLHANRTMEWYSDLAKVLLKPSQALHGTRYTKLLGSIPLIPTDEKLGDDWKTAPRGSHPIYFPESLGVNIPPGLKLIMVQKDACVCTHRKKLFRLLGVKDCGVENVVREILAYHSRLPTANPAHIIEHTKYLYHAREHLRSGDMKNILFEGLNYSTFVRGFRIYASLSVDDKLHDLFSGYKEAIFLHPDYLRDFSTLQKNQFIEWLKTSAQISTIPRLCSGSGGMHNDFLWLLEHKSERILEVLRTYWSDYESLMTEEVHSKLAQHLFPCLSGELVPLDETYLPLPQLVRIVEDICGTSSCSFLDLPDKKPKEWEFLSYFGVETKEDLDFYLWILRQPQFHTGTTVERAKKLYISVSLKARSKVCRFIVKEAFCEKVIALPGGKFASAQDCVYRAPAGFNSKPTLFSIYGPDLKEFFRALLKIPDASCAEALQYLEQLRSDTNSTMSVVSGVYEYLQIHISDSCSIDIASYCIAIPSTSGALSWKTPAECVWDDEEFVENSLALRSKVAVRHIVEREAPSTSSFFTNILKLPNAGIDELLEDLNILRQDGSNDVMSIFRLYERIQTYRRSSAAGEKIKQAFMTQPLVFLRSYEDAPGKWLCLHDCIWRPSKLRSKHALMPTLEEFGDLFRQTLGVADATLDMLITELLDKTSITRDAHADSILYSKELLLEISRKRETRNELQQLEGVQCWPCRLHSGKKTFLAIGDFYVNDRQLLFNEFKTSHTFLDFDFESSRDISELLRRLDCISFLSEKVAVETVAAPPHYYDHTFTQNYRSRAFALSEYIRHKASASRDHLETLLENVSVWVSPSITTHYSIPGDISSPSRTITKKEGGSSVVVNTAGANPQPSLDIYLSADLRQRECALVTDVPEQLVEALEVKPIDVAGEISQLLQVHLDGLNKLLVRKGIIGDTTPSLDYQEASGENTAEENRSQISEQSKNEEHAASSTGPDSGVEHLDTSETESSNSSIVESIEATSHLRPERNRAFPTRPQTSPGPGHISPESHDHLNRPSTEQRPETLSGDPAVTPAIYDTISRSRNMIRLRDFARNTNPVFNSRAEHTGRTSEGHEDAFDLSGLESALQNEAPQALPNATVVQLNNRRRRGAIPDRNQEQKERDFEVGFLGEHFIYTVLHDRLNLPNFSAEVNWKSSLRSRAGFDGCKDGPSDFEYHDESGELTCYFQQMQYISPKPNWLTTVLESGNKPLYYLEVKSTTSQDATTAFYMSGKQHALAKESKVMSATPATIYVIIRVSGLNVLENGTHDQPQWRVYLDPCTLGEGQFLNFTIPTYAVTATK